MVDDQSSSSFLNFSVPGNEKVLVSARALQLEWETRFEPAACTFARYLVRLIRGVMLHYALTIPTAHDSIASSDAFLEQQFKVQPNSAKECIFVLLFYQQVG